MVKIHIYIHIEYIQNTLMGYNTGYIVTWLKWTAGQFPYIHSLISVILYNLKYSNGYFVSE